MRAMRSIFTVLLAMGLMVFTTAWCCCIGHGQAVGQVVEQPVAVMSADHACCVSRDAADTSKPVSHDDAPPHPSDSSPCGCQGKVMEAPSRPMMAPVAHVGVDLPVFHLALLSADWLAPASLALHPHQANPPPELLTPPSPSLLAQACLLTI